MICHAVSDGHNITNMRTGTVFPLCEGCASELQSTPALLEQNVIFWFMRYGNGMFFRDPQT